MDSLFLHMERKDMSTEKNNAPVLQIVVDDGFVHVPMLNKYGDKIGEFAFQPTDVDIVNRFNESLDKFDEVMAPIVEMAEKGSAQGEGEGAEDEADDASMAAFNEARDRLFKLCDYIFNVETGNSLFGRMHPFSMVDGRFYCEGVFESLGEFLKAQYGEETKKVNARLSKYTERYVPANRKRKK